MGLPVGQRRQGSELHERVPFEPGIVEPARDRIGHLAIPQPRLQTGKGAIEGLVRERDGAADPRDLLGLLHDAQRSEGGRAVDQARSGQGSGEAHRGAVLGVRLDQDRTRRVRAEGVAHHVERILGFLPAMHGRVNAHGALHALGLERGRDQDRFAGERDQEGDEALAASDGGARQVREAGGAARHERRARAGVADQRANSVEARRERRVGERRQRRTRGHHAGSRWRRCGPARTRRGRRQPLQEVAPEHASERVRGCRTPGARRTGSHRTRRRPARRHRC